MRIFIVKKNTKRGERYCAYFGILARLGIFCPLNIIPMTFSDTVEECIKAAEFELSPEPKANKTIARVVDI